MGNGRPVYGREPSVAFISGPRASLMTRGYRFADAGALKARAHVDDVRRFATTCWRVHRPAGLIDEEKLEVKEVVVVGVVHINQLYYRVPEK